MHACVLKGHLNFYAESPNSADVVSRTLGYSYTVLCVRKLSFTHVDQHWHYYLEKKEDYLLRMKSKRQKKQLKIMSSASKGIAVAPRSARTVRAGIESAMRTHNRDQSGTKADRLVNHKSEQETFHDHLCFLFLNPRKILLSSGLTNCFYLKKEKEKIPLYCTICSFICGLPEKEHIFF